jgi:hypothetical protein
MKKIIIVFLVLYSGSIKAQYFMPEIASEDMFISKEVYVVTNNNDTIRGKHVGSSFTMGLLKSFNLKTSDGTKMKFKAADVKTVAIKPNKITNIEGSFTAVGLKNLEAFNDVINREWIFYDQAQQPTKKEKYALMQLVNPGFDSKIKVYHNPSPNAKKTRGIPGLGGFGGGDDKSYLVVYEGEKSKLYKKGKYKKEAINDLYKNCPVFIENYEGDKFKWKNFAEHVYVYDQLCNE